MRLSPTLALTISLVLAGCAVRPGFLPAPAKILSGFKALRQPRPDLPVGALWIDGYGLYGPGAAADNLETVKTLSAMTFDGGVQATLSLGVLQFLDLDPTLHDKVNARLNEVSIVRVKDMTKLADPAGHPRVYEALKAGSITVTTSHDIGLDIELHAAERNLPVFGRGTTGRLSTFTIEARDAFFAVRIARLIPAQTSPLTVTLDRAGRGRVRLGHLGISITSRAAAKPTCPLLSLEFSATDGPAGAEHKVTLEKTTSIALDAPVALAGALYDRVRVTRSGLPGRCDRLRLGLLGSQLEILPPSPNG